MSESVPTVEAPGRGLPPADHEPGFFQKYGMPIIFLAPTLVLLGVWVVYPTIRTIIRSFYDRDGDEFIGLDNYETLFSDDTLVTAIKNNFLWLLIVPAFVTAIGLVFAVLLERIRFSVAFKVVVFMPMAISLFAAGVIWRLMYEKDPTQGTINAADRGREGRGVARRASSPPRSRRPRPSREGRQGGLVLEKPLAPGDVAQLGLTGIRASDVPGGRGSGRRAGGARRRDHRRRLERLQARRRHARRGRRRRSSGCRASRSSSATTAGAASSRRRRRPTAPSRSRTSRPARTGLRSAPTRSRSRTPASSWLGASLITPAIMMAYIWVWAGFSMVVIAAGLAAIPRDLLEAARTDGATEWQVFRRVTIPLLAPVLTVVFITMLIYVLKVFDIVISVAPGSVQDDANVIALAMWRTSFGGVNDFGLGAAIAVFLFLLVIPILVLNVRRFRREV